MLPADTVQPIVLLVDKADPAAHHDAVAAAALASVRSYAARQDDAAWDGWVDGRFTKTVRRAGPKAFTKLAAGAPGGITAVGKARAVAFEPVTYEQMPRALRALQVSGTELPRTGDGPAADAGAPVPVIVLNAGLKMSTGKASAQAAHALLAWYLQAADRTGGADAGDYTVPALPAVPATVLVRELDAEDFAALADRPGNGPLIVDAGLTEIDPGTATAFVAAGAPAAA